MKLIYGPASLERANPSKMAIFLVKPPSGIDDDRLETETLEYLRSVGINYAVPSMLLPSSADSPLELESLSDFDVLLDCAAEAGRLIGAAS